eukprot:CFRG4687T1
MMPKDLGAKFRSFSSLNYPPLNIGTSQCPLNWMPITSPGSLTSKDSLGDKRDKGNNSPSSLSSNSRCSSSGRGKKKSSIDSPTHLLIPPTLKEVLTYDDDNFSNVRLAFLRYAKKCSFEENVLFLLDYERLKILNSRILDLDDDQVMLQRAQNIADQYIVNGAPHQINITHKIQEQALKHSADLCYSDLFSTFTDVAKQIRGLLEDGTYHTFLEEYYGKDGSCLSDPTEQLQDGSRPLRWCLGNRDDSLSLPEGGLSNVDNSQGLNNNSLDHQCDIPPQSLPTITNTHASPLPPVNVRIESLNEKNRFCGVCRKKFIHHHSIYERRTPHGTGTDGSAGDGEYSGSESSGFNGLGVCGGREKMKIKSRNSVGSMGFLNRMLSAGGSSSNLRSGVSSPELRLPPKRRQSLAGCCTKASEVQLGLSSLSIGNKDDLSIRKVGSDILCRRREMDVVRNSSNETVSRQESVDLGDERVSSRMRNVWEITKHPLRILLGRSESLPPEDCHVNVASRNFLQRSNDSLR